MEEVFRVCFRVLETHDHTQPNPTSSPSPRASVARTAVDSRPLYVKHSFLVEYPAPGGGLMQVELLRTVVAAGGEGFVVRVLDDCGETWEEEEDIGDVAVLNASGAVAASTRECPGLRPSTVYYAVDLDGETQVWAYGLAGRNKKTEIVGSLPRAEGYKSPCFWFAPIYSQ